MNVKQFKKMPNFSKVIGPFSFSSVVWKLKLFLILDSTWQNQTLHFTHFNKYIVEHDYDFNLHFPVIYLCNSKNKTKPTRTVLSWLLSTWYFLPVTKRRESVLSYHRHTCMYLLLPSQPMIFHFFGRSVFIMTSYYVNLQCY